MNKDSFIIITSYSNKLYILKEISKNKMLYNIKFYSFLELKKKLFFDYDNRAIAYVMKHYQVNLNIAKIYLDNLYYLKDYNHEKIKFLKHLKEELLENNLLIIDPDFKDYLKKHTIILYGYYDLTKEQKLILKDLSYELINKPKKNYVPQIYEAFNMEEETEFIANEISNLIHKGVMLEHIKIICSKEYHKIVKKIFKLFSIPVMISSDNTFYATSLAKVFLDNYNDLSIEENIEDLKSYPDIDKFISIINKSVLVDDKNIRKEFIIHDLKNTYIKGLEYDKCVREASFTDTFTDDDYVFLLGFNLNDYPKVYKDDDYLSDKVKDILKIDTSIDKNNNIKLDILNSIFSIKNLVITYKISDMNGICYPSLLINEINAKVDSCKINVNISYSKKNTEINYAKDLDRYYKYHIESPNLRFYWNLNIPYRTYENNFSGINIKALKKYLNHTLKLSYTSIEEYSECAFKYYLSYILKLNIFEENFMTIIGKVVHHILEIGILKEINIREEIIKFMNEAEYKINVKEIFYLEKLSEELETILEIIKNQEKLSSLKKYLFETEVYVYKDQADFNITIKGLIDKVMYDYIDGKEVLAVVDYKTGNTKITLDYLKDGLYMQLPIYLYLLKKSDRFKDAIIGGFYIQKVMDNVPKISSKKSLKEIRLEELKLQGYSSSNETILKLIDDSYQNSSLIKGLKFKQNGDLYSSAKILNNEQMNKIIKIVDEKIDSYISQILDGDFSINPKVINNENIACKYCKFKDICFKKKEDEVSIGGEKYEMDQGSRVCN